MALLRGNTGAFYLNGSVPGLDDDEVAGPDELERQVMMDEWGAVLALPVSGRKGWIKAAVDDSGSVDFERTASFCRSYAESTCPRIIYPMVLIKPLRIMRHLLGNHGTNCLPGIVVAYS